MTAADVLNALGAWPGARWLQGSGTAYLFVNAAHVLGVGALAGSALALDLRLLGAFPRAPLGVIGPFLSQMAASALALAAATGIWLFTVRPQDYAANTAFLAKMGLLALALVNIALQHSGPGLRRCFETGVASMRCKAHAVISACLWLAILVAGRWIGFL